MKSVFYYELFRHDELSSNDKIVYSFLVYKSIIIIDSAFNKDGDGIDIETIKDTIEYSDGLIDLYEISYNKLSILLNITIQTAFNSVKRLKELGLISDGAIKIIDGLISGRFFEIETCSKAKGELLIFYSYIKHKANYFGGCIDTLKFRLAEELYTTKTAITKLLNRLYKLGLAERLPNGKLKVN